MFRLHFQFSIRLRKRKRRGYVMTFKELFSKYKVYTIVSIIAILLLVAGGVTAGLLVGKQENQQLSIPVLAADFTDANGLEYTILSSTDLTVSVSGYSGTSTTVVIPETVSIDGTSYTVTTIAGGSSSTGAFANKTTLTSITIPSSITTMQRYAFYNCTALTEINFNATNMEDLDSYNLVFYNAGDNGTGITVNIGANVTKIPAYLFNPENNSASAPNITTVKFANNSQCISIGNYAFNGCSGLRSITIPDSVTSIGYSAFANCSGLTEINFNATNMEDLDSYNLVFYNAGDNGTGITVNIGANVTKIPAYLFNPENNSASAPNITTVKFANNSQCISIGNYAFNGCSGLRSITIPEGVISIGDGAFYGCSGLTEINFNATNMADLDSFINRVFYNAGQAGSGITVNIGANVTRIPAYLFYPYSSSSSAPNITTVNFAPNSQCTSIGNSAFQNCSGLTSVYYSGDVNDWVSIDFGNEYANPLYYANYFYLEGDASTPITSVNIDTATIIGDYAFYGYTNLTSVTIGNQVTSIGIYAFGDCSGLTEINFNATNMRDLDQYNYVFTSAGQDGSGITVNIGANVTRIPAYLFNPYNYTSYVPNIETVNFAPNSQCTSIGNSAFSGCSGLTSITIPEGVTSIGDDAFAYCSGLIEITIPDSVTSIGSNMFYNCGGLTSITIGEGVTSIGSSAFYGCSGLTSVYYLGDVNDWVSIDFDGSAASPLSNATANLYLEGQTSTPYVFPSHLDLSDAIKIGLCSLSNQTGITSITIGEQVASIGNSAFFGCRGLTEINFNATNMADLSSRNYAFSYAGQDGSGITVNIGANVTRIPAYLFYPSGSSSSAPKIVTVNFVENSQCASIGDYAFGYCSSLTSITIPEGVINIGSNAFRDCSSLTDVRFQTSSNVNLNIGTYAFAGNNSNVTYWVYNAKTLSTLQRIYSMDRNTFTNDNFVLRSVVVLEFNNDLGYIDTDIVSGEVINGGVKELKAIIYYGSAFLYWEIEREVDGETVITRETTNPLTVTVEGTMTIRAVFSQELTSGVALMIKLQGDTTDLPLAAIGEVRITGYSNLDGVESIRVQAMASKGYEFVGWEVDGEMLADYQGEEHRTTNLPKDLVQGKIVYAVFKVKEVIN